VIADVLTSVDLWRLGNAVLALVAVGLGSYRLWRNWTRLRTSGRLLLMALLVFEVSAVFGSIEQVSQNTPFGFRIMLGTVANIWAITAFSLRPSGADDART
jgi:hypothetical protein